MTGGRGDSTDLVVDLAILGGGLSGGLCALALAHHAPHLTVAAIEQDARLAGNHTWCCHANDLTIGKGGSVGAWFHPLVKHRWSQYQVSFPELQRTIDGDYLCVPAPALESEVTGTMVGPGRHLLLGQRVVSASSQEVTLASGRRVRAAVVLDARGTRSDKTASGYQKFVGWEIETAKPAPSLGRIPTLMDACVQQLDGYRFIYVLPMAPTRYLVEDTYFSRDPALKAEVVADRLRSYLRDHGVLGYTIVRAERGVLPMPWSAGDGTEDNATGPVAVGYRAGLFHPATGYSLGLGARTAEDLAIALRGALPGRLHETALQVVRKVRAALATNLRFARMLNFLAFRAIPQGWLRSLVFGAVYRLPQEILGRFYAAQTTPGDRLALLAAVARVPWPSRPALPANHLHGEAP
jgi:lycopene beta-cyclase